MAGMEELQVHSKSYLVRWMNVSPEHTISWSLQPHKKSLNFGIFKHPGSSGFISTKAASTHSGSDLNDPSSSSRAADSSSFVTEKLKAIGLKPITWIGKCDADKISQGTYDVGQNDGGNYALVFDNTFSKQISKTVTFVLLTYPTNCPPRSGHQIHHSQAATGSIGGATNSRTSPKIRPTDLESTESLNRNAGHSTGGLTKHLSHGSESNVTSPLPVHTGILQKRRRRRHQGYARRFFTLDFNSSTLSYYHDRNSSALRGAIPLSLAAVATNPTTREFSIDSGAEIWHLRALNDQEFGLWKHALEKASRSKQDNDAPENSKSKGGIQTSRSKNQAVTELRDWEEVENLVEKVWASKDKIRQLAKDTDPKYLLFAAEADNSISKPRQESVDSKEKRPFWKPRPKNENNNIASHSQTSVNDKPLGEVSANNVAGIHDDLMSLLHDLNSVVSEFYALIADKKSRKSVPAPLSLRTHPSIESDISEEFFDATDGNRSPLLTMHRDSDDEETKTVSTGTAVDEDTESLSGSEVDEQDDFLTKDLSRDSVSSLFPIKPKSLAPLPLVCPPRRTKVASPIGLPPSLISFMRKNVGKDLSTVSMPVSANEPISMLQRAAEQFEYTQLLDDAANAADGLERLIYVAAFAMSPISNSRIRERSIRKPFNPMLGETYEMIRAESGVRFIAEKVTHRPVQLAFQADSKDWSFAQSPKPTQKFWGKSVEVITEGKARLSLHSTGEHFSWIPGTSFLRNIIAGEKYVEPVGEMCIMNETNGAKVIVTFKAGGMFSGRSEEVTAKAYNAFGQELPLGFQGTWTNSLQLTQHGNQTNKTIWSAGPLVDKPQKNYGFTTFAASLNEITAIEKGKVPQTDSRLRPDQRALEEADVDRAEDLKGQLEERQRERRREMEAAGEEWQPRWFTKVEIAGQTEPLWRLKQGKEGYWEERSKGEWSGVVPVLKT